MQVEKENKYNKLVHEHGDAPPLRDRTALIKEGQQCETQKAQGTRMGGGVQ